MPLSTIFQLYCDGENQRPAERHWQTLSCNAVLSKTHLNRILTRNVSGDRHWLSYKMRMMLVKPNSSYHPKQFFKEKIEDTKEVKKSCQSNTRTRTKDKQWSVKHCTLKIEQHETHKKLGMISLAVPAPLLTPVVLLLNDTNIIRYGYCV